MKKPISATIDEDLIGWIEKEVSDNFLDLAPDANPAFCEEFTLVPFLNDEQPSLKVALNLS